MTVRLPWVNSELGETKTCTLCHFFRQLPGRKLTSRQMPFFKNRFSSAPSRTRAQGPTFAVWAAIFKTATELERRAWQGQVKMLQSFLVVWKLPCSCFSIFFVAVDLWQFAKVLAMFILTVFAWFFDVSLERWYYGVTYSTVFVDTTLYTFFW